MVYAPAVRATGGDARIDVFRRPTQAERGQQDAAFEDEVLPVGRGRDTGEQAFKSLQERSSPACAIAYSRCRDQPSRGRSRRLMMDGSPAVITPTSNELFTQA